MCGICGFIDLRGEPIDGAAGHRMMALLEHRGPDGSGSHVSQATTPNRLPSVFLGHRRLKVIDFSDAATQPLPNEDETVWVIYNGEIYNFLDLRRDLEKRGHAFRSHSDTETIVHAYEEFGDAFLQHLDGMFALALWDQRRGRLILARDRSGKKPLFYAFDGARCTFGSEIKAILVCPWVERAVATENIPAFLTYGYAPSPKTLYKGIFNLPPASSILVDADGLRGPQRYWELTFPASLEGRGLSVWEAGEQIRELLTQAVARRLVSDAPLGALLSGGLDSSVVVGLMSQLMAEPVRTFTIGFTDDASYDERPYAAMVARHFKTQHTEFAVTADAASLMELLLWHHDQPYADSSAVPTYLAAKLAREHVTVALNGDGGDEVFAGYYRFLAALMSERIPRFLVPLGQAAAWLLPKSSGYYGLGRRLERFLRDGRAPVWHRFLGWLSVFDNATMKNLLLPELLSLADSKQVYADMDSHYAEARDLPLLHRLLYVHFNTALPDDLHVKMDRMSMANSLETRSPMLDTALVEFVATLPPDLKIHGGQMKYVLRKAFEGMLPPAVLRRRKHGFNLPVGHWFRHQLRSRAEETLLAPDARVRAYLAQSAITTLFQQHVSGKNDHGAQLWTLLNLELWLRMLEEGTLWKPRMADLGQAVSVAEARTESYA